MHRIKTETDIMLPSPLPVTSEISGLFHLSVTHVGFALLFQQPGRGISFSHTYELCPLNRHHLEPSGKIGDGVGLISHSQVSSISQFIRLTKGVLFHWWEQSIEHCYLDESNSIKRTLHPGPQKKGLSEASSKGSVAAVHGQPGKRAEGMNTGDNVPTFSPSSCRVLIKPQAAGRGGTMLCRPKVFKLSPRPPHNSHYSKEQVAIFAPTVDLNTKYIDKHHSFSHLLLIILTI